MSTPHIFANLAKIRQIVETFIKQNTDTISLDQKYERKRESKTNQYDNHIERTSRNIFNKLLHLENTIDNYINGDNTTILNQPEFEIIEFKKTPFHIRSLKTLNIIYDIHYDTITIKLFKRINATINLINRSKIDTTNNLRLNINRILRLRNQVLNAKTEFQYNMTIKFAELGIEYDYDTQYAGGDDSLEHTPKIDLIDSYLREMSNLIDKIITNHDTLIQIFESINPDKTEIHESECSLTRTELLSKKPQLEHLKNLITRIIDLNDKSKRQGNIIEIPSDIKTIMDKIHVLFKQINGPPDIKTLECKDIFSYTKEYNAFFDISLENELKIINYYEDIIGSVRVYLRLNKPPIKPTYKTQIGINVKYDPNMIILKDLPSKTYGPFFSVFDNMSNKQIYSGDDSKQSPRIQYLKGLFDQLRSGYSNFIFGYGYSGSGKTYSLFGKSGKDTGILQLGLNDLNKYCTSIRYKAIFELYGQISPRIEKTVYSSNLYVYHDPDKIFTSGEFPLVDQTFVSINNKYDEKINPINKILDEITQHRINQGRIKSTINNPESSRGHLFILFEVKCGDTTSYLTIVDMAGVENPIDIKNSYFPKESVEYVLSATSDKTTRQLLINNYKNVQVEKVLNTITEGIFINETINHMKYYLFNRQNKKLPVLFQCTKTQKAECVSNKIAVNKNPIIKKLYNPSHYFINPVLKSATATPTQDPIHFNTILNKLESLSKKGAKNKFALLSVINPLNREPTIKTLEYSQTLV